MTEEAKERAQMLRAKALQEAGKKRTEVAVEKAERAIRQLIKDGGAISFTSVARVGGVSAKFLHNNTELSERIRFLAQQQTNKIPSAPTLSNTANGESSIIAALRTELRREKEAHREQTAQLNERIKELEMQVQVFYGRLVELGS